MSKLRHGFKAEADWYAQDLRQDLKIEPNSPISIQAIAILLGIKIYEFSDFLKLDSKYASLNNISALCFHSNGHCAALVNDRHSKRRINSSLCHEFAHILLCHKTEFLSSSNNGCRNFDQEKELEANWLAGSILIPNIAAHHIVFSEKPHNQSAEEYGVSLKMLKFRLQVSGAIKKKEHSDKKRLKN